MMNTQTTTQVAISFISERNPPSADGAVGVAGDGGLTGAAVTGETCAAAAAVAVAVGFEMVFRPGVTFLED